MTVRSQYRSDIDGLRALAVVAVVLYHAFPSLLPGGFIGVDIFFVISGYLISGHIVQGLASGHFSLLEFYQRRIRRIFPALIVVLVACLAFGWIALMAHEYAQLGKHAAAGAGFVANLALWQEVGYFDNGRITKPLLHLWSLGVEEQFYIVWPLLVWAGWKLRANLLGLIALAIFLSGWLNLSTVGANESAAFYSPLTRFWQLLAGAALAELERRRLMPAASTPINIMAFAGATLIAYGLWTISDAKPYPGSLAAIPTLGAALIIAAGPGAWLCRHFLSNRVAVGTGLISYPLYLWHWPLLSFAYIVQSQTPDRVTRLVLVLASIALATATYFFLERPVRFGRWKASLLSWPLLGAMSLVGAASYGVWAAGGIQSRPAVQATHKVNSQMVGPLWAYTQNEHCTDRYPFPETKNYGWWFCMLDKAAPPTVLITGGSFANQLYPGLALNPRLANQNFLSIGTCSPLHIEGEYEPLNTRPCSGPYWVNQNRLIEDILKNEPTIKTVIVGGLAAGGGVQYTNDAVRRLKDLSATGAQIIVMSPHYKRDLDIRGCFARPFTQPQLSCDIGTDEYAALLKRNAEFEQELKSRMPRILFFEQNQAFCQGESCSLVANGFPLIRDGYHHISEYGSVLVGNSFVEWAETHQPDLLSSTID